MISTNLLVTLQYEGRLLYCGQDDWVHVNCALWSAEVYEDTDGSLQNLKEAYSRGKMLVCIYKVFRLKHQISMSLEIDKHSLFYPFKTGNLFWEHIQTVAKEEHIV